jgi:hypothetical protein
MNTSINITFIGQKNTFINELKKQKIHTVDPYPLAYLNHITVTPKITFDFMDNFYNSYGQFSFLGKDINISIQTICHAIALRGNEIMRKYYDYILMSNGTLQDCWLFGMAELVKKYDFAYGFMQKVGYDACYLRRTPMETIINDTLQDFPQTDKRIELFGNEYFIRPMEHELLELDEYGKTNWCGDLTRCKSVMRLNLLVDFLNKLIDTPYYQFVAYKTNEEEKIDKYLDYYCCMDESKLCKLIPGFASAYHNAMNQYQQESDVSL